jgi:PhnB protein
MTPTQNDRAVSSGGNPRPADGAPPPLTPYLTVEDARAAIAFYQQAFGAVELARHATPDGDRLMHAALLVNGALLMLSDDFPEMTGGQKKNPRALGGTPVTLHLSYGDVDAAWERATRAGARVIMPLADQFWGDRYGIVEDPYGHRWSLARPGRRPGEEALREGAEQHFPPRR